MSHNGNGQKRVKQPKLPEAILENMAQAIVVVDSEFRIVEFNSRFIEMFSMAADKIEKGVYYKSFFELWASKVELPEGSIEKGFERINIKDPFVYDVEYIAKGERKWFQMFHNPLEEGGFVRTFTDITERKNAENLYIEKSTEIDRFFSLTLDFLCIADMNGYFKRLNNSWEEKFGYKKEELIGKRFSEFIHPDDFEDTLDGMKELAKGKTVVNLVNRYRCKDGSYRWLEWRAIPFENTLIYAAARDITERKSFEEILRQNEEKYRFITENVGDLIWQIDKDYNYIYVSPSVENILFYTPEEILGKSFYSFLTPNSSDYLNEMEKMHRNEYKFTPLKGGVYELQYIRKDGSLVWCEVHASPLYTPDGKLIFSQGVTRDIGARKEAERKLKDYAAELKDLNLTKDRFFSIIAHDLKSPFSGLIGMTTEFKNNARDFSYDEIATFGNEMYDAVINTYRLLENLLEWSRIQLDQIQFNPITANVRDEVEKIISLFAANAVQKEISLSNNVDSDIFVSADINMIGTILRNLIGNAIKFTNRGGIVKIDALEREDNVLISVADNGVGMEEEISKRLFRSDTIHTTYGTEKEKGSGLGLLLCKEFVAKHNGEIWVESSPGKGTKFCFTMPAINEKQEGE
jgi:PAS domain S-box-containing protein